MRISDCSSDVCSSDLHGWLVLLRRRAARRDQALWPGWPAARLLAARSRADPAGIDLCRLAAPERVRQPLLRTGADRAPHPRSEEHTSELQSLMSNSYAVFCLKKKKQKLAQSEN